MKIHICTDDGELLESLDEDLPRDDEIQSAAEPYKVANQIAQSTEALIRSAVFTIQARK